MKKEKETENKKKTGKMDALITRESFGAVGCIFTLFAFLILVTGRGIFGDLGYAIKCFLLGTCGSFSYFLLPLLFLASVAAFLGKRFLISKTVFLLSASVASVFLVIHSAQTYSWSNDGYLSACFSSTSTAGGWFGALPIFLFRRLAGKVGAIVIASLLLVLFFLLTIRFVFGIPVFSMIGKRGEKKQEPVSASVQPTQVAPQEQQPVAYYPQNGQMDYNAPMPGYSAQPQNAPAYIPVSPEIRQRPGVQLPDSSFGQADERQAGSAFSPFGYGAEQPRQAHEYPTDREFLFGGNPAENYRKNLIFDSNANVNKKPAADLNQPIFGGNFVPTNSYTNAYENSINADFGKTMPEKIIADNPFERNFSHEPQVDEPSIPNFSQPAMPISEQPRETWRLDTPTPSYPTPEREEVLPREEIAPTRDTFMERTDRFEEPTVEERLPEEPTRVEPDYKNIFSSPNPNLFASTPIEDDLFDEPAPIKEEPSVETFERDRNRSLDIFDEPIENNTRDEFSRGRDGTELRDEFSRGRDSADIRGESEIQNERDMRGDRDFLAQEDTTRGVKREETPIRSVEPPKPMPKPKPKVLRPYQTAPIHFFDCRDVEPDANTAEVEENKRTILETLSGFKVTDSTIASVTYGPTVTRYNVAIPRNISPKKVVSLDQEIAISLYAANGVNIYPNFEEGAVSIEVPNKRRQFVQLGCMLTGDGFVNSKSTSLTFTMGKDVGNRKVYGDIRKMTHLLVAGASGSGKSVFLRCLIISLIVKYSPSDLRLILIDPKKTEFVIYDHLPHLVINEIITETPKVIQSLNWAIGEMNRRYTLFEQKSRAGTYVVNIDEYNANLQEGEEKLPKIVIIVDELADLMLAAQKDIEDRIQNLTQKSRAAGIHMIIATQRPSTDVITGVIKSNLKTRIAFSVTSEVDSRVILDATGAHKLLGKGDMLYTMEGIATPIRVQSPSIESEDAQKVVNYIKMNNDTNFDEDATAYINKARAGGDPTEISGAEEIEPVYIEALRCVVNGASASISMIQRKCSVGYNKAGKIIEWMEEMGYVSAFDGAKARKVLITKEEFEALYGPL